MKSILNDKATTGICLFLAAVVMAAALLCFPRPVQAEQEVKGSIVYMNERGQYIVYGYYKKAFAPLEEVEIMNFDRPMGVGYVEHVSETYMVVRLLWLKPEFFARDATRVRKTFISPLPTVKKEIGADTPIYFDLAEEMDDGAPQMVIRRMQTTPYGEYIYDSEVITVDPVSEPWKKGKINPRAEYVVDPEGKIRKLGVKPQSATTTTTQEVESDKKVDTTSTRHRRAARSEETEVKEDLEEKK